MFHKTVLHCERFHMSFGARSANLCHALAAQKAVPAKCDCGSTGGPDAGESHHCVHGVSRGAHHPATASEQSRMDERSRQDDEVGAVVDPADRDALIDYLSSNFSPDKPAVRAAANRGGKSSSESSRSRNSRGKSKALPTQCPRLAGHYGSAANSSPKSDA